MTNNLHVSKWHLLCTNANFISILSLEVQIKWNHLLQILTQIRSHEYLKRMRSFFEWNDLWCFLRLNFKSNLTLKIVSATTIMGLLRTWAKAKTWISSRLSYIILDDVLEPLEAVDEADEDSPWESKSLELGRLTMLSLDLLLWEFDSEELKNEKCNWFHAKSDWEKNSEISTLCDIIPVGSIGRMSGLRRG